MNSHQLPAGALAITIRGISCLLLPDRGVFFPAIKTLLIADVHIGKAATFRSLGVPVPGGTTQLNLNRISALITSSGATSLYILGDFFHGPMANQAGIVDELRRWREQYSDTKMTLIGGNHDAKTGPLHAAFGMAFEPAPYLLSLNDNVQFRLLHEPVNNNQQLNEFSFAGHLHPVQRIQGRADSARLPCFWLHPNQLVLPAFGEFTGGHPVQWQENQQVFVTDSAVVHDITAVVAHESSRRSLLRKGFRSHR